jgi:hypothetical protein
MAIVYHGELPDLRREVARLKPVLDARYREILGDRRAAHLAREADRLLGPKSFYDSPKTWNRLVGDRLKDTDSNKLMIACIGDFKVAKDGTVTTDKIKTSPAFYISDNGFNASASSDFTERPIASYVHEYNHFATYALQQFPLYLASIAINDHLKINTHPINIVQYARQLLESDLSTRELSARVSLAIFSNSLTDFYERSNRVLDKLVLESIDINTPLDWRNQPRGFNTERVGPLLVQTNLYGDPFFGSSDQEVVDHTIKWEKYFTPTMTIPKVVKFLESIKSLSVGRIPIEKILKKAESQKKKKKKLKKRKR